MGIQSPFAFVRLSLLLGGLLLAISVAASVASAQDLGADKPKAEVVASGLATGFSSGAFAPDGARVVSGGLDGTAKLWDVATGALLFQHSVYVYSVAFSPGDARVVSAGGDFDNNDCTAKLWHAATGALLRSFIGHTGRIRSVVFSPEYGMDDLRALCC